MPKYLQISAWLKEVIQTGRYKVGERLPSEVELSKMCGVNRNTLRQAIAELTSAGILRKEKRHRNLCQCALSIRIKTQT